MADSKIVSRFGIQRKIVANMTTESWQNIPHVSYLFEPDLTKFLDSFEEFKKKLPADLKITLNIVVLKAIAEALKAAPDMNAHLHFEQKLVRGKMTRYSNVDISMPWLLPNGEMMTITMKDLGNRSLINISEYMAETAHKISNTNLNEVMIDVAMNNTMEALKNGRVIRAVQRLIGSKTTKRHRISPLKGHAKKMYDAIPDTDKLVFEDLKQGTITVSNIGSITRGQTGEVAMLMIIPPQVVAIAISSLQKKPRVVTNEKGEDEIKIVNVLPLCICFDHRALDFGDIKPFMDRLQEIFDHPEEILKLD